MSSLLGAGWGSVVLTSRIRGGGRVNCSSSIVGGRCSDFARHTVGGRHGVDWWSCDGGHGERIAASGISICHDDTCITTDA